MSINYSGSTQVKPSRMITRSMMVMILNAALEERDYRFARQAALTWLANFPGDLEINVLLARTFLGDHKTGQAIPILEKICSLDPEFVNGLKTLATALLDIDREERNRLLAMIYALGERVDPSVPMPGWAVILRNAREALAENRLEDAETMTYQLLALNQDQELVCITHLRLAKALNDQATLLRFADLYHSRWPDCLQFKLALAEARLEAGDEAESVNLLHQCVAADAVGQTSLRWWGDGHPYQPLWPKRIEINFDPEIPAKVASRLGWNQLPASANQPAPIISPTVEPQALTQSDETAQPVQVETPTSDNAKLFPGSVGRKTQPKSAIAREAEIEFEKIAKRVKSPMLAKADGRYPIYVVLSMRNGLRIQYGEQTANVLDKEMQNLAEAVKKRPGWGAMVFYPDDIECTGKLGLKTVSSVDPWKIKLSLADLDQALARKGGRIGAVVIVGGNDVVPFHRLPNPTDDIDQEVLSDNPYSTLDSNYFVPEWPVGRLPGETGSDVGLLLQQLRATVRYHAQANQKPGALLRINRAINFWRRILGAPAPTRKSSTIGYSASVWKRSSLATFRPIGEGKQLLVSPPTATGAINQQKVVSSHLGYYNLHGLEDTAEWYGQRDPADCDENPDYPVALTLTDLPKNGHSPKVIFTEACYGGLVQGKTEQSSIALRFLSIGTLALIGSSCVAYGSVTTPLVGADLLGFLFWNALQEGYSTGEALTYAKVGLVREMTKRQGYLDGEDQKTLISFILYGDPLIYHDGITVNAKRFIRQQVHMSVKTISDQTQDQIHSQVVSERILQQAKLAVEPYLPGLDKAEIHVSQQQVEVEGKQHRGEGFSLGKKVGQMKGIDRTVVIFRKKVQFAGKTHYQYARVTMGRDGKLMKMAFSR